jgi:hypothetical protein
MAGIGEYSFDITLLSLAALTVYGFTLSMPAILYAICRYSKADQVFLFDLINIYGYSFAIWIPVSFLCVIPSELLRWVFCFVAFLQSGIESLISIFFGKDCEAIGRSM